MKVEVAMLLNALDRVKPGLASSDNGVDQADCYVFTDGKVVTYNDEVSVSCPVEGMDVDIEGAVRAEELYKMLNKLNASEVKLEVEEEEIKFKAGRSRAGLVLQKEVQLPLQEIGEIGEWQEIPEGLVSSLNFATGSASKTLGSFAVLSCVHASEKGHVEASDNLRITRCELDEELPVSSFLMPASSAKILHNYNMRYVAEGQGWIHFSNDDGVVFSSRILESEFPDVEPYLKAEGQKLELPDGIMSVLDRAAVFREEDDLSNSPGEVLVELQKDKIKIRGENSAGWFEETGKVNYSGDELSFFISPEFFRQMLEQKCECQVASKVIKFIGQNWTHLIALTEGNG